MYAIIVTGGKQYKVSEGDEIKVEKLDVEPGDTVTFDKVIAVSDKELKVAGDVENASVAASKIGDDYLQRKAYGREMPDSFNHGRSDQRVRWLKKGITTGDPLQGDTFTPSYNSL